MKDLILHGDVYNCLNNIKDKSISVAITSPPYWQQRDYGFEDQIGQEKTPEGFIGHLKIIFEILKEKLRDNGIFFLNIGDKYQGQYGKSHLLLIPYRLAYHMVKNGWILEDIIIWYKPNHMPSSVKDRFTNTYEPVFVFTKNSDNIYNKTGSNVFKISLQQTQWKHTATFPERLVDALLNKVELNDSDRILDPFAGTGTVAVVVRKRRNQLLGKKIFSIMIDKGDKYIKIMEKRCGIKNVKEIDYIKYNWNPVLEENIPNLDPYFPKNEKHGEVFIAKDSKEFLSCLNGIKTDGFKKFFRKDALFFYGIKSWSLNDFYYFSRIFHLGYVTRNIIVVSKGKTWFPIFMFANDNTRVEYKFYIDRVRIDAKTEEFIDWDNMDFLGMRVKDITGKKSKDGKIIKILKRYDNRFPKFVKIRWKGSESTEYVLHSDNDDFIQEGLKFKCPECHKLLVDPFELISDNICPSCKSNLWHDIKSIPVIEEPQSVLKDLEELRNIDHSIGEEYQVAEEKVFSTNSKFEDLDRINWGQSPGARKVMLGEYFTKMRLYRLDHPISAEYLTILRNSKGLSVKNVTDEFPKSYKHTVGHWFRKDFGGSMPIPKDITHLQKVLDDANGLLNALKRTALKLQIVKQSNKGKNPGDFIEGLEGEELINYLKKLYIPSQLYIKSDQ